MMQFLADTIDRGDHYHGNQCGNEGVLVAVAPDWFARKRFRKADMIRLSICEQRVRLKKLYFINMVWSSYETTLRRSMRESRGMKVSV